MMIASAIKNHRHAVPLAQCHRWLPCAAAIVTLFATAAAWAAPAAPTQVVARSSGSLTALQATRIAPAVPLAAADIDLPIGFNQPPLDDHVLGEYRGAGEQGVTPDVRTQHVAVILWDERGHGSSGGSTKSGATGSGNSQAANVVTLRIR